MTDDIEYEAYEITRDELLDLPRDRRIAPGLLEHNYASERSAMAYINRTAHFEQRVEIWAHDESSGLMIQFLSNPGHSAGASVDWVQDEMHRLGGLSNMLRDYSPIGEFGHIDFFQFRTHTD